MRIPRFKVGTPLIIRWFDAHQDSDAHGSPKELVDTNCELEDMGFYLGSKGAFVSLATERWVDESSYRHTHHIPKVNIISITKLVPDGK